MAPDYPGRPCFKFKVPHVTSALVIIIMVSSVWQFGFAQADLPKIIQPSPTAASLGKYAEIPVGYHAGIPSISVPLYTITEGTISVPISLSYHASGIRVSEKSSWVGLGWSLNCGGVITRSVQHVPDEGPMRYTEYSGSQGVPSQYRSTTGYYKDGYLLPSDLTFTSFSSSTGSFSNGEEQQRWYKFMDAAGGNIDCEPDLFSYNIGGYSGTFRIKVIRNEDNSLTRTAVFSPKADVKVDIEFQEAQVPIYPGPGTESRTTFVSFVLKTPDGFKYTFGGAAATEYTGSVAYNVASFSMSDYVKFLPTSWFLTRIDSPEDRFVTFEYEEDKYSFFDLAPETCWGGDAYLSLTNQMILRTVMNGRRLSRIVTSTEEIIFNANTTREDLSDYENLGGTEQINNVTTKRLDRIDVKKLNDVSIRKFDFLYDYFQSPDGKFPKFLEDLPASKQYFVTDRKRLKLLSVTEKSGDESKSVPPYVFTYNEVGPDSTTLTLPRRISYQQDHWGGYNGAVNNNSLISFPAAPRNNDRDSHESYLKIGVLQSIKNPMAGKTTFDFEANQFYMTSLDETQFTSTNYSASSSLFQSGGDYVITPFEVSQTEPDIHSPCNNVGLGCYEFSLSWSVTMGDPRPVTSPVYDINYAGYESELMVAIYQENGTIVPNSEHYVGNFNTPICTGCTYSETTRSRTVGNSNTQITLPPGKYYLKARRLHVSPSPHDAGKEILFTASMSVTLPADYDANYTTPVHTDLVKGAGLRIARITINDGVSNINTEKTYSYPTGILYENPNYYYSVEYTDDGFTVAATSPMGAPAGHLINDLFSSSSILPMQNTQGSPVGYDGVTETQTGNGYTRYFYDVLQHSYSIPTNPYFSGNYVGYNSASRYWNYPVYPAPLFIERGNLHRKEVYGEDGMPRLIETYEYEIGNVTLDFTATKIQFLTYRNDAQWAAFAHYPQFSGISRLLSTTTDQYDQSGHNPVTTVVENAYNGFNHLSPTEVKHTIGNEQILEKSIYPPDYGTLPTTVAGVKHLIEINKIIAPIEKYTIRQNSDGTNQRVTSGVVTMYKTDQPLIDKVYTLNTGASIPLLSFNHSNMVANSFLPDNRYIPRINYKNYDSFGNVTEVAKENDASIAYVWGYNGTLPIAEIKNAGADQVLYTSFEDATANTTSDSFSGEKALSVAYNVTLPGAGTYKLTYWKKDLSAPTPKWELTETSVSQSTTIGGSNILIDEVRLYPAGASITTYTYKIGFGISSVVDPNNVISFYEYDGLGRLITIKDDDVNVRQHFKYHYGSQE